MFRLSREGEYETESEGGIRHLFRLGPYEFQDTLDAEETFHHYLLDASNEETGRLAYEVDGGVMYEFMARYLAGEYEKSEYRMERSPGHDALLDLLEIAMARARAGETEIDLDELTRGETEVLGDEEELEEVDGWEDGDDEGAGEADAGGERR